MYILNVYHWSYAYDPISYTFGLLVSLGSPESTCMTSKQLGDVQGMSIIIHGYMDKQITVMDNRATQILGNNFCGEAPLNQINN